MAAPLPFRPKPLAPVQWRAIDPLRQPVCPCCEKRTNLPMLVYPGLAAMIRKRPDIGGRGPTMPDCGWTHFTYRHRACDQILEIALQAMPFPAA